MKKITLITLIAALTGCVAPAPYKAMLLTQQDKDEAACKMEAAKAKNPYYPGNFILDAQERRDTFDLCMKSKGWVR
jgi:hypothetical protein